ncbi:glycosyltransferase family 4 protein [Salibacter halophilus]|uniref:Glycosyltransferase family 4 protein n=1 Tax=Salibacter halophilus TaxID=1803916 RepID=A0A6N6M9G5_9FLAO|nr:glycosyltransferase family 4 protein [Salibacter halophilus]KAB1064862.1 glycosyltransferase family 4 protein [Salibacter halophilus]
MKILLVHNFYKLSGGEDKVFKAEKDLLIQNGHDVITYTKSNNEIDEYQPIEKLKLITSTSFSQRVYEQIDLLLKKHKPDICHVHNFLPLISPSVFYACSNNKIPTILTLHNYRLMCTNGLLFRDGHICEECVSSSAYHSVLKKCYRNSHLQTYAVARMLEKNKDVWFNLIDGFFCLSHFAKQKFIEHGLPKDKITVKPNFIDDGELFKKNEALKSTKSEYLIYVGRLEINKGTRLLKRLAESIDKEIVVIGEGPLENKLHSCRNINIIGKKSREETLAYVNRAKALILPSISYEGGLPLTALEAFSCRTPVIATNIGSMKSMIQHEETGLLFDSNSIESFNSCVNQVYSNPELIDRIINQAYHYLKTVYTKQYSYQLLIDNYNEAILSNENPS